jgi:8-amino-7-oxononanoate synthase
MHFEALHAHLAELAARGRGRGLSPREGIDFASNDYLALGGSPRLARAIGRALDEGVAIGSGGSRLLRGNDPAHERLEADAAKRFGVEATLFLASGYAANIALMATLPQRGDLVVYDALVHASVHDGRRLGRAEWREAAHNDADAVADRIAAWRKEGGRGTPWIVVESLYSMDGDRAPIDALAEVAARHDGVLIVDEAHATGVWGAGGRGLAAHLDGRENVVTLKTFGKALGCEGALVCGPRVVRDFLIARARHFIFSTAPSPLMAVAARESLTIIDDEPERRERLHALIAAARARFAAIGIDAGDTQIVPVILGEDRAAVQAAATLREAGFDVRAIRPPTVAEGSARLRIALTLHVDDERVAALCDVLGEVVR